MNGAKKDKKIQSMFMQPSITSTLKQSSEDNPVYMIVYMQQLALLMSVHRSEVQFCTALKTVLFCVGQAGRASERALPVFKCLID